MQLTKKQLKLMERRAWYSADQGEIEDFYKQFGSLLHSKTGNNDRNTWFWALTPENPTEESIRIHTGLPKLISKKMSDIILANGYEYSIEDDADFIDYERLGAILSANRFDSKLGQLIEIMSWSGDGILKISIDPVFDEPLVEVIDPEQYEPVIYKGRIIADKFKVRYKDKKDREYELQEVYGVDREKGSYIRYKLYRLEEDTDPVEVPLETLQETKDLEDIYIKGLNYKLSFYIPNRLPNSENSSSIIGESDYAGAEGLFNSLDEIYSTYLQEFRDSKLNRYFPSNFLMLDPNSGEYKRENSMKTNHILYSTGISEDIQGKIVYEQGDLRSDKHEQAFRTTLMYICNTVGLSPLTLGVTGLESIISSAESQQEREKVSIRTREMKIDLLEEVLEQFFAGLLVADDILNKTSDSVTITKNRKVNLSFNDYLIKSKQDKIIEVKDGLESGVFDLKRAIEYVHDDLSEDEQMEILINSKIERGITQFNAQEAEYYFKLFGPQTSSVDSE